MPYLNTAAVPLSLAVFLATDSYDHNDDQSVISATTLIKPIRQTILSSRIPEEKNVVELVQMVNSRMGSAIHDGIERSWLNNHKEAMEVLGYPKRVIDRIQVNPSPEHLTEDSIPVYLEQRAYKKVGNYTVSGKFDFVAEGRVEDFKSTSVYTAMHNTNDEKYILQGSIYRWLNPTLITQGEMAIQFIFTDWSAAKARTDPKYPQQRIQQRILPLKPVQEIDTYIRKKLTLLDSLWDAPEEQLPECTDEDLWRSTPIYKYYKNPSKMARSTKNFDTFAEAMLRKAEDGNTGVVVEQPGQVTACKYCSAFALCTQKDRLIASGDLIL